MKIKVEISIGLAGCRKSETVDLGDEEYTDNQLEEIGRDIVFEMVEWRWELTK